MVLLEARVRSARWVHLDPPVGQVMPDHRDSQEALDQSVRSVQLDLLDPLVGQEVQEHLVNLDLKDQLEHLVHLVKQ